jgi:hypothetical protein
VPHDRFPWLVPEQLPQPINAYNSRSYTPSLHSAFAHVSQHLWTYAESSSPNLGSYLSIIRMTDRSSRTRGSSLLAHVVCPQRVNLHPRFPSRWRGLGCRTTVASPPYFNGSVLGLLTPPPLRGRETSGSNPIIYRSLDCVSYNRIALSNPSRLVLSPYASSRSICRLLISACDSAAADALLISW